MNTDFFGFISDFLGIPMFIPILIFAILILGLMGFIFFVYKKISNIKTDDENQQPRSKATRFEQK